MTNDRKRKLISGLERWVGSVIGILIIGTLIVSQLMTNADIKRIESEGLERIIIGATNNQVTAVKYGQHNGKSLTTSIFSENGVDSLGATLVSFNSDGIPHAKSREHEITMILEHHKTRSGDFCTIGVNRWTKQAISYDSVSQQLRATDGSCSDIDIQSRAEILWEQLDPRM